MNTVNATNNSPVNQSVAFQFGVRDAQAGNIRDPQKVFTGKKEQDDYAAGVVSVTGANDKPVVAPIIVPNYKANGKERVIRTASDATKELKASATQANRIQRMLALTAEFLGPNAEADIIFAV